MNTKSHAILTRRTALRAGLSGSIIAGMATPGLAQGARVLNVALTEDSEQLRAIAGRLADRLSTATGGALGLQVGDVLGGADAVPAVGGGAFDAVIGSAAEWISIDPAFGLFAGCPFGLSPREFEAWILYGGGQAEWDALGEGHGLKPMLVGDQGARPIGWFKTRVNGAADFAGRSFRTTGLGTIAVEALGATAVDADIASVASDADATDGFGLAADIAGGLPASYPYLYTPSAFRPHSAISLNVNFAVWATLSDVDRLAVETCCLAEADYMTALVADGEMRALAEISAGETSVEAMPVDLFTDVAAQAGDAVAQAIESGSQMRNAWYAYSDFRADVSRWSEIGDGAFSVARAKALGI